MICRDISETMAMESQLRELNARLEKRVNERSELARKRAEKLRALAAELTLTEQRERRRAWRRCFMIIYSSIWWGPSIRLGFSRNV